MLSAQHTMKFSTQSSQSAVGIIFWVCQSPEAPADSAELSQKARQRAVKPGFRFPSISKV